jgi:hypothetical protein
MIDLPVRRRRNRGMRFSAVCSVPRCGILLLTLLMISACVPKAERIPPEQLQIRINLLCTTCDDFLRCQSDPKSDDFLLYRLREKSFWAQVATIWDYLIQSVRPKTADTRPLAIYEQSRSEEVISRKTVLESGRARVDLRSGLITLPDALIDMRNGEWRDLRGEILGSCSSMPRREGYAWIRSLLGRER